MTRHTLVPIALLSLAAAASLAACASTPSSGPEADRRFYEGRCGVCHVPFQPSDYAPRDWVDILDDMAPKAGLTRAQRERVYRYLTGRSGEAASAATPAR